jgi:hypothetical protein
MKNPFRTAVLLALALLAAAQVRDPLPVPDLPGYRTLKCDFHMHTVFSDGEVWPTVRVSEAWREGLDAIALTDHIDYQPHKEDVRSDPARPHALARALAEQLGILLVPALEIAQGDIHFNILFITDFSAYRGLDQRAALRLARQQNAYAFWNHPGWRRPKAEWLPLVDGYYQEKLFQGMELVNGRTFYPEAYPWVEEKKLAILANTDVHGLTAIEYPNRTRTITLVFAAGRDLAALREALVARRTAAWQENDVWGAEAHLAGLWQGAVKPENPELRGRPGATVALRLRNDSALPFRLQVRQGPAWLRAVRGAELRAQSVAGLPLAIAKEAPAGSHEAELALEVSNFHIGPGRQLTVRLPVRVTVAP